MRAIRNWAGALAFSAFIANLANCSSSNDAAPNCSNGLVHCTCDQNHPCGAGLSCFSNVCVEVPDGALGQTSPVGTEDDSGTTPIGTGDDGPATVPGDENSSPLPAADAPTGPAGTNLITNGDFSQGKTLWDFVGGTSGTANVTNGQLCVSAGAAVILGWPEPSGSQGASISAGGSYTFSYKVQSTGGDVTIDAKIGQSVSPYAADSDNPADMATATSATVSHVFTAPNDDTSAGIAFSFTPPANGTVCFQEISVVHN